MVNKELHERHIEKEDEISNGMMIMVIVIGLLALIITAPESFIPISLGYHCNSTDSSLLKSWIQGYC